MRAPGDGAARATTMDKQQQQEKNKKQQIKKMPRHRIRSTRATGFTNAVTIGVCVLASVLSVAAMVVAADDGVASSVVGHSSDNLNNEGGGGGGVSGGFGAATKQRVSDSMTRRRLSWSSLGAVFGGAGKTADDDGAAWESVRMDNVEMAKIIHHADVAAVGVAKAKDPKSTGSGVGGSKPGGIGGGGGGGGRIASPNGGGWLGQTTNTTNNDTLAHGDIEGNMITIDHEGHDPDGDGIEDHPETRVAPEPQKAGTSQSCPTSTSTMRLKQPPPPPLPPPQFDMSRISLIVDVFDCLRIQTTRVTVYMCTPPEK